MTGTDPQASFAATFVDELIRRGVRHAFVSPGSRNTPLSLALVARAELTVHVVLDERSAAFAALGVGRATGVPALCCCTSGTAAVNYHPAVVEAHHSAVPLLVVTADRPARLRNTGANQTIDQTDLYGVAARAGMDVTVDADARVIAELAVNAAQRGLPGPAHVNLQFDEPLVPTGAIHVEPTEPVVITSSTATTTVELPAASRPVVLAGWGADVTRLPADVPVLADPLSGLRHGPDAISTYEALLRVPGFMELHRPDLVIRVGMPLTGKVTHPWCDGSIPQVLVTADCRPADPFGSAEALVAPNAVFGALAVDPHWTAQWRGAERDARAAIDATIDAFPTPFDGRIVRDLAALDQGPLYVGSSMPVRDLEYFASPSSQLRVHANRGASGIDGCIATAAGVAIGSEEATVGVIGDLTFLHDTNGLLVARDEWVPLVLVVLDNDGGGIFEFLPQRDAVPNEFERLFGTPHDLDLVAVANAHGVTAARVVDPDAVVPAVQARVERGEPSVIVVPSDREENVARHRAVWHAVAAAVKG
ncbi:MAG: 2-succinyl-5-enolpyruvyl-6-hydroxy-3-cyclohexene-1-carboxylic-acid synthase [Acidimicrobiia bacterium]